MEKIIEMLNGVEDKDAAGRHQIMWLLSQKPEFLHELADSVASITADEKRSLISEIHLDISKIDSREYTLSMFKEYARTMGRVKIDTFSSVYIEVDASSIKGLYTHISADNTCTVEAAYRFYKDEIFLLEHRARTTIAFDTNVAVMFTSMITVIANHLPFARVENAWDLGVMLEEGTWTVQNDKFTALQKVTDYMGKTNINIKNNFIDDVILAFKDRLAVGKTVPGDVVKTLEHIESLWESTIYKEEDGIVICNPEKPTDVIILKRDKGEWSRTNSQNKTFKRYMLLNQLEHK